MVSELLESFVQVHSKVRKMWKDGSDLGPEWRRTCAESLRIERELYERGIDAQQHFYRVTGFDWNWKR